jgi:FkbM family methyltransferase
VKQLLKTVLAYTPYHLVRRKVANRFQAIDACLRSARQRGFSPTIVIDGGAYLGEFCLDTRVIFPDAKYHLIEPQPACSAFLSRICDANGFAFYECALAEKMGQGLLTRTTEPSTGVHLLEKADPSAVAVSTASLDDLFGDLVDEDDSVLLKLDLQGYELHALRGGTRILRSVEVIVTEVSFFAQAYEPPIVDLLTFLDTNGFVLYDIASLSGRASDDRLKQGDFIFVRRGSSLLQDGQWD